MGASIIRINGPLGSRTACLYRGTGRGRAGRAWRLGSHRLGNWGNGVWGNGLWFEAEGLLGERKVRRYWSSEGQGNGGPRPAAKIFREKLDQDQGLKEWQTFLAGYGVGQQTFQKVLKTGLGALTRITSKGGVVNFGGKTYGPGQMTAEQIGGIFEHLNSIDNQEKLGGLFKWLVWRTLPIISRNKYYRLLKVVEIDRILGQSVRLFNGLAAEEELNEEKTTEAWGKFYFKPADEEPGEKLRYFGEQKISIDKFLKGISRGIGQIQLRQGLLVELLKAKSEDEIRKTVEKYLKDHLGIPSAKFYHLYSKEYGNPDDLLNYRVSEMISYGHPGQKDPKQKDILDGEKWLAILLSRGKISAQQGKKIGAETIIERAYRFYDRSQHLAGASVVLEDDTPEGRKRYAWQLEEAKKAINFEARTYVDPVKYEGDKKVARAEKADPELINELFYLVGDNCLVLVRPEWKKDSGRLFEGKTIYEIREIFEELLSVIQITEIKIQNFRNQARLEGGFCDKFLGPLGALIGLLAGEENATEIQQATLEELKELLTKALKIQRATLEDLEELLTEALIYKIAAWPNSYPRPLNINDQVETSAAELSGSRRDRLNISCQGLEKLGSLVFDEEDFRGLVRAILQVIITKGLAGEEKKSIDIRGRAEAGKISLIFEFQGKDCFDITSSFQATEKIALGEVKALLESVGGHLAGEEGPAGTRRIIATFFKAD